MSFRDLRRYESQKAAYDSYKAWQALTPDLKQAAFAAITDEAKRSKPERVTGYLSPFNQVGTALKYIRMPVLKKTQEGQGSAVGNALATALDAFYIDDTETAPVGGAIDYKRFKAAKLSFTLRSTFTKKNSRITKRAYLKPDVDTYSAPFGQSVGDQDYAAALVILVPLANTWMEAATAPAKRSYKFTPEGA
ncbi:hypothetical protein CDG76_20815 [Nostoc sp. 'Peltigera membranacea cyanobiont' 210A]|uniref:hypothetical protein n=1 Tax=Nostoc sp. 'Peltigera membranacea cyanobiont' 210A TaxID=2014529 RepID=UPI000B95B2BC|nr:hypothetical protein [Nostoc sp. 'Peltigera membranacea cyanobiont' 210A]OYD93137.1 hypothetical protein CDG76_20815 [Nostoc sp. 'Peltigera membranacea cyanobiont' 210A]